MSSHRVHSCLTRILGRHITPHFVLYVFKASQGSWWQALLLSCWAANPNPNCPNLQQKHVSKNPWHKDFEGKRNNVDLFQRFQLFRLNRTGWNSLRVNNTSSSRVAANILPFCDAESPRVEDSAVIAVWPAVSHWETSQHSERHLIWSVNKSDRMCCDVLMNWAVLPAPVSPLRHWFDQTNPVYSSFSHYFSPPTLHPFAACNC